jgi:hypothetical protein
MVSRVTGATVNTSGAMSNRTTTTVDANRNFRDECLARARAKAAATVAEISSSRQPPAPNEISDEEELLQGSQANIGSAAAIPKANNTSAKLPSVSKDGGAPA